MALLSQMRRMQPAAMAVARATTRRYAPTRHTRMVSRCVSLAPRMHDGKSRRTILTRLTFSSPLPSLSVCHVVVATRSGARVPFPAARNVRFDSKFSAMQLMVPASSTTFGSSHRSFSSSPLVSGYMTTPFLHTCKPTFITLVDSDVSHAHVVNLQTRGGRQDRRGVASGSCEPGPRRCCRYVLDQIKQRSSSFTMTSSSPYV